MRKLLPIMATLALLSALPTTSHAFGAFLGWWNAEDLGNGFGIGISKGKSFTPLVKIEGRASWFSFSEEDKVGPNSVSVIPVEAVGKLTFGIIYGGVGLGWYFYDQEIKNNVGFQVLGGAQLPLAALTLFGEIRYVVAQGEFPGGGDVKANGIGINAGINLNLLK